MASAINNAFTHNLKNALPDYEHSWLIWVEAVLKKWVRLFSNVAVGWKLGEPKPALKGERTGSVRHHNSVEINIQ